MTCPETTAVCYTHPPSLSLAIPSTSSPSTLSASRDFITVALVCLTPTSFGCYIHLEDEKRRSKVFVTYPIIARPKMSRSRQDTRGSNTCEGRRESERAAGLGLRRRLDLQDGSAVSAIPFSFAYTNWGLK